MLSKKDLGQRKLEYLSIEELVPKNHLLRKIDRNIDFSFVSERMDPLYSPDKGRPAIPPVVLFKMLFIGYLYGIRSERRLVDEICVNAAYRWFLGYGLKDKIPDHSTISQNRHRRFNGRDVFRELFESVIEMAIENGYIEGKSLFTDSTHLKANANKHKFKKKIVKKNIRCYLADLDHAIARDRKREKKKQLPAREEPEEKEIKESTTDPESGYLTREGKPQGFYYLDHRTCDGKYNLITDVHVTAGNIYDSLVYLDRLDYQVDRFGFNVKEAGLDAGYNTPDICRGLIKRDIFGVAGYRNPGGKKGLFRKTKFRYDKELDVYICPGNEQLKYKTTTRDGYRQYVSESKVCKSCELLPSCTQSKNHQKIIMRHIWEKYKEQVNENRLSERGKKIKKRRSETVERSFADSKELHSYRYARFRGRKRVEEQSLMTAIVQNLKKIAKLMDENPLKRLFYHIFDSLKTLIWLYDKNLGLNPVC